MSYKYDIGFENCMDLTETDVNDFVAGITRSDSAEVSPAIREAVFDQLEYDLNLTLYRFERQHIRNSELLQLIRTVADTNKFSVATYVREAVVAENDRQVTEQFLRTLSERTSHREWYDGPVEKRKARELRESSAFVPIGRTLRAEIELLAPQH